MGIPISSVFDIGNEATEATPRSGLRAWLLGAIGSRLAAMQERRRRRRQNEMLLALDDRTLADIGINRRDLIGAYSPEALRRDIDIAIR